MSGKISPLYIKIAQRYFRIRALHFSAGGSRQKIHLSYFGINWISQNFFALCRSGFAAKTCQDFCSIFAGQVYCAEKCSTKKTTKVQSGIFTTIADEWERCSFAQHKMRLTALSHRPVYSARECAYQSARLKGKEQGVELAECHFCGACQLADADIFRFTNQFHQSTFLWL